jgi:8-oxo-dGTP diphosphatase
MGEIGYAENAQSIPGEAIRTDETNDFVQWRHAPPEQWRYCPLCAHRLENREWDGKLRRFCTRCGFVYWERPLPAVATIILDQTRQRLVLVRRRYPPQVGSWTFPGGGVEFGESITETAIREAQEETGLTIGLESQLGTWSTPTHETLITFYMAYVVGGVLKAGSDAEDAQWFPWDHIPPIGFSVHQTAYRLFVALREQISPAPGL